MAVTTTCLKDFTITVQGAPSACAFACFNCDDAVPAPVGSGSPVPPLRTMPLLRELVGDYDLSRTSGTNGKGQVGKIGGSLYVTGSLGDPDTEWENGPSAHWVFTSFTIRFWFNFVNEAYIDKTILSTSQWSIARDDAHIHGALYFLLTAGGQTLQSNVVGKGAWHRVIFWFRDGIGMGAKIDNGPTISLLVSGIHLAAAATDTLRLVGDARQNDMIDNIAIWDRKLSEAEMTSDWNSGNGVACPCEPGFYAYWKFEESAVPVLDSTTNTDLSVSSYGAFTRVAGKIAFGLSLAAVELQTAPTSRFQFASDFTIRFWLYDAHTLTAGSLLKNDPAGDQSFEVEINSGAGNNGIIFKMWDATNTECSINPTAGAELSLGWHRIIIFYVHGIEMGVRIDNNPMITLSQAAGIYATAGNALCVGSSLSMPGYIIDELAVWDRILTTQEMTDDWNSGNGTTYPTI